MVGHLNIHKQLLSVAFRNVANDNQTDNENGLPLQTGEQFRLKPFVKNTVSRFRSKITPLAASIRKTKPYQWFKGLEKNKFFPKFMAFKGGFSSIYLGILLAPAILGYGTLLGGAMIGVCAIALVGTGVLGAINYGGHILHDTVELFRTKVLKKDPRPKRPRTSGGLFMTNKDRSPWGLIRKSKIGKWMGKTGLARIINRSPMYQKLKSQKLWRSLDKIGKDQDVVMRMFATGGALTTVAISAVILMQSAVPLTAALSFTGAGLFAAYIGGNLIGGVVALGTHGFHLFDSSKKALRRNSGLSEARMAAVISTPKTQLQVGIVAKRFAKSALAKPANDSADKPAPQLPQGAQGTGQKTKR